MVWIEEDLPMDRIQRLPLPVLLPVMFVAVGGGYFLIGLATNPSREGVIARLIGALFYATGMTVAFGIVIAVRRRKAGGADAVAAMLRSIRTGVVPADADLTTWTPELERYQVRYRRNRWSVPVVFGVFALLFVSLGVAVSPVWWLLLVLFLALGAYSMWDTRRALRNLTTTLGELRRRRDAAPTWTMPRADADATWTLPDAAAGPDRVAQADAPAGPAREVR
jgi:hypothetical protein